MHNSKKRLIAVEDYQFSCIYCLNRALLRPSEGKLVQPLIRYLALNEEMCSCVNFLDAPVSILIEELPPQLSQCFFPNYCWFLPKFHPIIYINNAYSAVTPRL